MKDYPLSAADNDIRPLLSAGHFFPREKEELSSCLTELAAATRPKKARKAAAALVPHGALRYSGSGLCWALQQLSLSSAKGLVIFGLGHRDPEDTIWLPDYSGFQTPFGVLSVSREKMSEIAAGSDVFKPERIPFEEEPCFDLILCSLANLRYSGPVLPVLFGSADDSLLQSGLDMLELLAPDYLPLASANFLKNPEGEMIHPQKEGFLMKLLETYFHAAPDRWYHGESPRYCAALWEKSGTALAGETE